MDEKVIKELRELERILDKRFMELVEKIHLVSERISIDVATLKAQAAFFGFISGLIPGIFVFIFDYIKK